MDYVLYAIPFFLLLIGIELLVNWLRRSDYYRVNDSINSLTAGIVSQMTGLMKKVLPFTMYIMVFDQVALFELPREPWVWVLAFVFYDFCYYWNHRLAHEVNLLWAAHVVHHSSEEYNLTTALRQTSGGLLVWVFYLPLAVIGVEPYILISVGSLNLIYQFWVHTRHVPKLGWFEWFFVSPSNHRVHHAQNEVYIDRNYGGVFIVWDRLFGTFQEELEHEPVIFGIRKPLRSWNPIWCNLHVYTQLIKDAWRAKRWQDKIAIWFKPTGWRPTDVEQDFPLPAADLTHFKKFDIPLSNSVKAYCLWQHLLVIAYVVILLFGAAAIPLWQQLTIATAVVLATTSLSFVMEDRRIGWWLEVCKHVLLGAASLILPMAPAIQLGIGTSAVVSLVWLLTLPVGRAVAPVPVVNN